MNLKCGDSITWNWDDGLSHDVVSSYPGTCKRSDKATAALNGACCGITSHTAKAISCTSLRCTCKTSSLTPPCPCPSATAGQCLNFTSLGIEPIPTGEYTHEFNEAGLFGFACKVGFHCRQGMSVQVAVSCDGSSGGALHRVDPTRLVHACMTRSSRVHPPCGHCIVHGFGKCLVMEIWMIGGDDWTDLKYNRSDPITTPTLPDTAHLPTTGGDAPAPAPGPEGFLWDPETDQENVTLKGASSDAPV